MRFFLMSLLISLHVGIAHAEVGYSEVQRAEMDRVVESLNSFDGEEINYVERTYRKRLQRKFKEEIPQMNVLELCSTLKSLIIMSNTPYMVQEAEPISSVEQKEISHLISVVELGLNLSSSEGCPSSISQE